MTLTWSLTIVKEVKKGSLTRVLTSVEDSPKHVLPYYFILLFQKEMALTTTGSYVCNFYHYTFFKGGTGRGGGRGRERTFNRLHAQCRDQHGARSHDPEVVM